MEGAPAGCYSPRFLGRTGGRTKAAFCERKATLLDPVECSDRSINTPSSSRPAQSTMLTWGPRRARRLAAVLSGSHDALDDVERRRQAMGDRVQARTQRQSSATIPQRVRLGQTEICTAGLDPSARHHALPPRGS